MKITKERLLEIIKEELASISEVGLTRASLAPEVEKILNKLSPEEQAIVRQFISLEK